MNLITTKQLAELLGISRPTIWRHLQKGYPIKRNRGNGVDVNQIKTFFVGGMRVWDRDCVEELLKEAKERQ